MLTSGSKHPATYLSGIGSAASSSKSYPTCVTEGSELSLVASLRQETQHQSTLFSYPVPENSVSPVLPQSHAPLADSSRSTNKRCDGSSAAVHNALRLRDFLVNVGTSLLYNIQRSLNRSVLTNRKIHMTASTDLNESCTCTQQQRMHMFDTRCNYCVESRFMNDNEPVMFCSDDSQTGTTLHRVREDPHSWVVPPLDMDKLNSHNMLKRHKEFIVRRFRVDR